MFIDYRHLFSTFFVSEVCGASQKQLLEYISRESSDTVIEVVWFAIAVLEWFLRQRFQKV